MTRPDQGASSRHTSKPQERRAGPSTENEASLINELVHIPGPVRELLEPGDGLLPLAHRDDIAAMKLAAIASRGSRKDFVDLWVLISRHRPLEAYLELYRRKFATRDVGHVVRSLTYFEDAEQEPELRMLMPLDWEEVKRDLLRAVGGLLP